MVWTVPTGRACSTAVLSPMVTSLHLIPSGTRPRYRSGPRCPARPTPSSARPGHAPMTGIVGIRYLGYGLGEFLQRRGTVVLALSGAVSYPADEYRSLTPGGGSG